MTIPEAIEEIITELKRYNVPQDFWKKVDGKFIKTHESSQAWTYLRYCLAKHYDKSISEILTHCKGISMLSTKKQFENSIQYVRKHKEFRERFEI
jgi:hypothetical protein